MARTNFDAWIPEEHGGPVITKLAQVSAVEQVARTEPMSTDTKSVPRTGGLTFTGAIAKGSAYDETAATEGEMVLKARKFGKVVRIADEDLKDTAGVVDIVQAKQLDWARVEAIGLDNSALAVTAAENGTTIPFTSVYRTLTQTNSDLGYTANANLIQTAGALTYGDVSDVFSRVENGFWADGDMVVIAHPGFKGLMRGLVGSDEHPIFDEPNGLLWGAPIVWSLGAKTSAVATAAPTGNPLMFVANRQYLVKGDRSGPEYQLAGADSGAAFLTDEALLKMRVRRGFAVADPNAVAAIEITTA